MIKCFNPYFHPAYNVPFPCGHCINCRLSKANEWSLRLFLESQMYNPLEVAFVTLTYDNEHIPDRYELCPRDTTLWLKRLRKRLSYKIRYYLCGEYGDQRGRPHYHAIVFGLKSSDYPLVDSSWKLGITDVQTAGVESFHYVAGYVTKKIGTLSECMHTYGNRYPPFHRQSLGIGRRYLDFLPFYTPVLQVGGKIRYLGRYLRNKLAEKFNVLESIKKLGIEQLKKEWSEIWLKHSESFFELGYLPLEVWKKHFQGEFNLALARYKLTERKSL